MKCWNGVVKLSAGRSVRAAGGEEGRTRAKCPHPLGLEDNLSKGHGKGEREAGMQDDRTVLIWCKFPSQHLHLTTPRLHLSPLSPFLPLPSPPRPNPLPGYICPPSPFPAIAVTPSPIPLPAPTTTWPGRWNIPGKNRKTFNKGT